MIVSSRVCAVTLLAGMLAGCLLAPQFARAAALGGLSRPAAESGLLRLVASRIDEMEPAARLAYILGIQEELLAHGYHVGPISGEVGSKTKGAIRQYQRDAGLPVDGVATKELLDHLKFALPKVYARTAKAPSDSVLVRDIQIELQRRGYYQGPIDGLTGPMTREAISLFQTDAGLPVTGRVGGGLLADLRNADSSIRRY